QPKRCAKTSNRAARSACPRWRRSRRTSSRWCAGSPTKARSRSAAAAKKRPSYERRTVARRRSHRSALRGVFPMTTQKPRNDPYSRFIPREEIEGVSAWRFAAVDGSEDTPAALSDVPAVEAPANEALLAEAREQA